MLAEKVFIISPNKNGIKNPPKPIIIFKKAKIIPCALSGYLSFAIVKTNNIADTKKTKKKIKYSY